MARIREKVYIGDKKGEIISWFETAGSIEYLCSTWKGETITSLTLRVELVDVLMGYNVIQKLQVCS